MAAFIVIEPTTVHTHSAPNPARSLNFNIHKKSVIKEKI